MRIENISQRLNLVSNSSRGHQKRTKKIKREKEKEKEKEELENHYKCSREKLRRKKKNGEKETNQKEN